MTNLSLPKSRASKTLNAPTADAESFSAPQSLSTVPWPDPVNGAALLDELAATIRKHVVLEQGASEAAALWAVHTHAIDAFSISPRLGITSVVMRCGKTTLLDVLHSLVREPLVAANATPAGIFHQIQASSPTLLIDEADTFLSDKKELIGILNSGHRKNTAYVLRAKGRFSTWAPVVIAMIGRLPETLDDRCIPIRLQRRRNDEVITPFRSDCPHDLDRLARMSTRWAADNLAQLANADPKFPTELQNRVADNWRPLLAIADAAGGKWPALARKISVSLTLSKPVTEQEPAVMLLEDIYAITRHSNENLFSADLATALIKLDHRPWADWKGGKPITTKAIANLLAPFKIAPVEMRTGLHVRRGYRVGQFEDAFARYVSTAAAQPPKPLKKAGNTRNSRGAVTRTVAV